MFGMGTGGSLRLLSPETKLSLDAFAAALSGPDASAIVLPRVCLPALSLQALRTPGPGALALRTLKTAQGRFAPA